MTWPSLSALNLTGQPDVMWGVAILVAAGVYGWTVGRDRTITILLSLYAAFAIVAHAPIIALLQRWLHLPSGPAVSLFWFLGVFVLIYSLLWYSGVLHDLSSGRGAWWQSSFMGLLMIGLAVSMVLMLLGPESVKNLPSRFSLVFLSDAAKSFWLIAPFVFVLFLHDELPQYDMEE